MTHGSINTTITPIHAKPTSHPMPDPTSQLIAAARRAAHAHGCPAHEKLVVSVKLASGEKILQVLAYPTPIPAEPAQTPLTLSAKQKRILTALLENGPMKGDALARAVDLGNRSSLSSGRGIRDLMERQLVVNDEEHGYTLTASGEDLATEISES